MTLRDIRQEEFANLYINSNRKNILNLCPRFGKIRTSIKIFEKIKEISLFNSLLLLLE